MKKNQKVKRSRFTNEEKQALLRRWRASEKSGEEFAAQMGVGMSTLFKWKRRLGVQATEKVGRPHQDRKAFKPVRLRQTAVRGIVKIAGPHGMQIEVGADADEAALQLAVKAMASCG